MPYKHEKCKAGKTTQHTYYYSPRSDMKEGSRRRKANETPEAQKKVNSRFSLKRLTWIMNANFDGTSLYITWSYHKLKRPLSVEAFKKDADNLLRGLRRIFKKEGKELKYIWIPERGERGATHIHMVINAIEISKIKSLWDKGYITVKPMDDSGQYRDLAAYFIKYSEKTMKTAEGFGGRRYNSSRNLIIPEPTRRTTRSRNAYNHTIEIPQGHYLDKGSIREAWHEVTGFMYFTYTLIKDGRSRDPTLKEKHTLNLETGEVIITEKTRKGRYEKN